MSSTLRIKRGTRAQLDAIAIKRGFLQGEPLLITDENRLAVALSTSSYQAMAKQGETTSTSTTSWSRTFLTMGA